MIVKKALLGILLLSACSRPPEATTIAPAPVLPMRATVDREPAASLVTAAPETKTFATYAGDATWVRSLSKATTFAVLRDFDSTTNDPIELTWLVHPSIRIADAPPGEEYAGLYESKFQLVIKRGAVSKTIELGAHPGGPEASGLTYCERKGFKEGGGYTWSWGAAKNVVGSFELSTMQGSNDVMLILGSEGIHVIERHEHDGSCPVRVHQGPFEVCADMKWKRALEIPLRGEPRVAETAFHVGEDGSRAPVDCTASYSGAALIAP